MKKLTTIIVALSLLLVFSGITQAGNGINKKPDEGDQGQDLTAATPNLSFPVIATDIIDVFYQKEAIYADDGVTIIDWELDIDEGGYLIPIEVTKAFNEVYVDGYPGNVDQDGNDLVYHTEYILDDENTDDCPYELSEEEGMKSWLERQEPWYAQPTTTTSDKPNDIWNAAKVTPPNSWQADWYKIPEDQDYPVEIDFVDWGNPMENTNPIVGYRFPVEVALYTKLEEPMTAYKMACLEYPASRIELFGTSDLGDSEGSHTKEVYFATVLTNQFTAEVHNPDGTSASIDLAPGIGPSGKMNFASAGGGWIPTMPGWHRIWLHLSDPLISLAGAIVNNDEHYVMTDPNGCKMEDLSSKKLELSGITRNMGDTYSTYIDVLVVKPSGKTKK